MAVKRRFWAISCGLWFLGLLTLNCIAQTPPEPTYNNPRPAFVNRNGKKFFAQNGKALPLLWAFGLTQASQLDDYKASGFNTLVITLDWSTSPDEPAITLAPGDLKTPRALADAAAKRGLNVIYQLPAAPTGREHEFKISGEEGVYSLAWSSWVTGAVTELKDTPNLLGWMLPNDPRSLPIFDNKGFAKWLADNYAGIEILNKQWNQKFTSLSQVTLETAGSLSSDWQKNLETEDSPTASLTGLPLPNAAGDATARGWSFHPAALAMALYKWDAYRALMEFWANTLHAAAPDSVLFAGRLPDYAQLLSLPSNIDISLPDLAPGVAEADQLTHNPQGTSIARRGGRFAAIPVFATSGNPALPAANLPRFLSSWLDAALAHGASGLAFASWPELQQNAALKATVSANLGRLQSMPFALLWDRAPQASAAILLTPLAEGMSVQKETPLQAAQFQARPQYQPQLQNQSPDEETKDSTGRGLYGFGEDIVSAEPSNLVFTLRHGTAFGAVDYLAPEDLADEHSDLSSYNTLLLPQALSISEKASAKLGQFVSKGGVIVADLGLGAAQAAGKITEISPSLLALFGMSADLQLQRDKGNWQLIQANPLLPSWSVVQPGTWLTGGMGGGPAFRGPIAGGAPRADAISLASTKAPRDPEDVNDIAFLTYRPLGAGGAIFAPLLLWQNWLPGAVGFDGFHGDLFSRGAAVVQNGARSFAPTSGNPADGTPMYPETVNFADSIALLNHAPPLPPTPPTPEGTPATPDDLTMQATLAMRDWSQVQTSAPGEWLWTNVITAFSPTGTTSMPGSPRLAPAEDKNDSVDRGQLVALHAYTPPGAMLVTRMAPVRVRHLTGDAMMARLMEWQEKKAAFVLWPNATSFTPQPNNFQIAPGPAAGVRAVLYDSPDGYRILPNSRHKVTITTLALPPNPSPPVLAPPVDPKGRKPKKQPPLPPAPTIPPPVTQEFVADAQGHLTVEGNGAALMFEVIPAG